MAHEEFTKVIGFYAYLQDQSPFLKGPACIIASSESALKEAIRTANPKDVRHCTIRKARLIDVLEGIVSNVSFAFDQSAYQRFYSLAKKGLKDLPKPEEFPINTPYITINSRKPEKT